PTSQQQQKLQQQNKQPQQHQQIRPELLARLERMESRATHWETALAALPAELIAEEDLRQAASLLKALDADAEQLASEPAPPSLPPVGDALAERLAAAGHRWERLGEESLNLRQRVERGREALAELVGRLRSLADWLSGADARMRQWQLLVGGDAETAAEQAAEHARLAEEMRRRRPEV
uniref:Dystrophin n=2 Tax=Macrostomum lignano TaxID=282301 RepID=A0A1I8I922_9PLAT